MSSYFTAHEVVFQTTAIYVVLALSFQVVLRTGVFSFAGVGFFGIGGYAVGNQMQNQQVQNDQTQADLQQQQSQIPQVAALAQQRQTFGEPGLGLGVLTPPRGE